MHVNELEPLIIGRSFFCLITDSLLIWQIVFLLNEIFFFFRLRFFSYKNELPNLILALIFCCFGASCSNISVRNSTRASFKVCGLKVLFLVSYSFKLPSLVLKFILILLGTTTFFACSYENLLTYMMIFFYSV